MAFPSAQRLMLRIEAAGSRFCVDAAQVVEVAAAPPAGEPLHGNLVLDDLSTRLGGQPEARSANAVVLDTSPTLGLRVGAAPGVEDATQAAGFALPGPVARLLEPQVRGALMIAGRLHFELDAQALARATAGPRASALPNLRDPLASPQSLVFRCAATRFAVPLHLVRQVVPLDAMLASPLPGPMLGLVEHGTRLWPVWSVGWGEPGSDPTLAVLVEGTTGFAALAADSADGVRQGAGLAGVSPLNIAALFS